MKFLRFAVPAAIVVFLGAGTSFAAEGALPGQPLYAVKTGVNEKFAAAFTFSADAKAGLDAALASRRLAEANELAAEGKLDTETAARIAGNFEAFADRAEARIEALRASGNVDAAERISASFASALQAHDRALGAIVASRHNARAGAAVAVAMNAAPAPAAPMAASVKLEAEAGATGQASLENDTVGIAGRDDEDAAALEIAVPLRAALFAVANDHRNAQAELTAGTQADAKVAAERKISIAAQMTASARAALAAAKRSSRLSADATAKAGAELDLADRFEAEARAKTAAGEYRGAVERANKAAQAASEVNVLLRLQARIGGSASAAASAGAPLPSPQSSPDDGRTEPERNDAAAGVNLFSNSGSSAEVDNNGEIRVGF